MDVRSVKYNCYVEGVKIPLINTNISYKRNTLVTAQVTIPIGTVYHPKQWANALVQITSIQNTKERLLFQGLCYENLISDRKSTRLNSSHVKISYAVFCLKKK